MSLRRTLVLCGLLALSACRDKPAERSAEPEARHAEEAEEGARQPAERLPQRAPEQSATPTAAQLPVPEDFQAETAAAIVRANYLGELDKLETELRADEN